MTEERPRCPHCGAEQPADAAADWLCPQCVMEMAIEEPARPTPGPPLPPAVSPDAIAPHFPAYEIEALIGRGGMGVVYRARNRKLDRLEAIKILLHEIENDPIFTERFEREARALARLSHPGIVTVHDFGEAGGFYYLVMEYVDGANLRELLRDGQLTARDALSFVPQICDALQYAHDAGVVHRDIKPENILIDQDGRVRIADFGLAKMLGQSGESRGLTISNQGLGTPHYMAPEQVSGGQAIDHRADIYSLGVVLYEMLTGELPIGRFAAPSKKRPCEPVFDAVVMKSLESEPDRRYQQVREVKSELEKPGQCDVVGSQSDASNRTTGSLQHGAFENSMRQAGDPLEETATRQEIPTTLWIAWGLFLLVFASCWMSWGDIGAEHYFARDGRPNHFFSGGTVELEVWEGSVFGIPCWFVLVAAFVMSLAETARHLGYRVPVFLFVIPGSFGLLISAYILSMFSFYRGMERATPGIGAGISFLCFAFWCSQEVQRMLRRRREKGLATGPSRFDRFARAALKASARSRGSRGGRRSAKSRRSRR